MKVLTEGEKGYLAGIIDGEGTIRIACSPSGTYSLRISVASTTESVMLWMKDKLEQPYSSWTPKNPKHSICYTLALHGTRAQEFLAAIEPYMVIKKAHALIAAGFPVNDRYHKVASVSNEVKLQQIMCSIQLRDLNVRGNGGIEEVEDDDLILNQSAPPKE